MRNRHVIQPGTRIYCEGTELRPCPARAWWYHEGKQGRPQKRCTMCRLSQRLIFNAESRSSLPAPRCPGCGLALSAPTVRYDPGCDQPVHGRSKSYCICDLLA